MSTGERLRGAARGVAKGCGVALVLALVLIALPAQFSGGQADNLEAWVALGIPIGFFSVVFGGVLGAFPVKRGPSR
ncbi:MAG: hypothetical protein ACRCYU_22665 [Nocardioides sp.]